MSTSVDDPYTNDLYFYDSTHTAKIKKVAIIDNQVVETNLDLGETVTGAPINNLNFTESHIIATTNIGPSAVDGDFNVAVCVIAKADFVLQECFTVADLVTSATIIGDEVIMLFYNVPNAENNSENAILAYNLVTKNSTPINIDGNFLKIFELNQQFYLYGNEDASQRLTKNLYQLIDNPADIAESELLFVTSLNSQRTVDGYTYDLLGNFVMINPPIYEQSDVWSITKFNGETAEEIALTEFPDGPSNYTNNMLFYYDRPQSEVLTYDLVTREYGKIAIEPINGTNKKYDFHAFSYGQ